MNKHTTTLFATCLVLSVVAVAAQPATTSWRNSPAWHQDKAEWALYDAVRPLYGQPRRYEATIFTNKQYMDPGSTTKAAEWNAAGNVEVFKHNLSEMIPTENYTYRFLTTVFARTDTLEPYKVVASTQEDCGATYKEFFIDGVVIARSLCYFPDAGPERDTYLPAPEAGHFAFHDALSLTLRDYPFDAHEHPPMKLDLVPDQTDTHKTPLRGAPATVTYVGRETVNVPRGAIDAHHLQVAHEPDGGAKVSDYWFAADPEMLHVMVKYAGPYGVTYELKKLGWWKYWDRSQPRPE